MNPVKEKPLLIKIIYFSFCLFFCFLFLILFILYHWIIIYCNTEDSDVMSILMRTCQLYSIVSWRHHFLEQKCCLCQEQWFRLLTKCKSKGIRCTSILIIYIVFHCMFIPFIACLAMYLCITHVCRLGNFILSKCIAGVILTIMLFSQNKTRYSMKTYGASKSKAWQTDGQKA